MILTWSAMSATAYASSLHALIEPAQILKHQRTLRWAHDSTSLTQLMEPRQCSESIRQPPQLVMAQLQHQQVRQLLQVLRQLSDLIVCCQQGLQVQQAREASRKLWQLVVGDGQGLE